MPLRLLALALFLLAALPVLGASPAAAQSAPASSGDLLATIGRLQADNKGAGTGNEVRTDNVTARLVADLAAATPGGTLTLAFVQDIREGWHTTGATRAIPGPRPSSPGTSRRALPSARSSGRRPRRSPISAS